jgi:hypothetical protein
MFRTGVVSKVISEIFAKNNVWFIYGYNPIRFWKPYRIQATKISILTFDTTPQTSLKKPTTYRFSFRPIYSNIHSRKHRHPTGTTLSVNDFRKFDVVCARLVQDFTAVGRKEKIPPGKQKAAHETDVSF